MNEPVTSETAPHSEGAAPGDLDTDDATAAERRRAELLARVREANKQSVSRVEVHRPTTAPTT
ncbi:hypothetical protein ACWD04_04100 [Streptomyces sp. NPDC002911]